MTSTLEEQLRTSLRRQATAVAPPAPDEAAVRHHVQRRRRRRQVVPAIGAVAVIAAGLVVTARQNDDDRTATAALDGDAAGPGTPAFTATDDRVPYVSLPGWQIARYGEYSTDSNLDFLPQVVLRDGERQIVAAVTRPPGGYAVGEDSRDIDVNGVVARVGTMEGHGVAVAWPVGEATAFVTGTGVTEDDVVLVARGLEIDAALHIVGARTVPAGMTAEFLSLPAGTGHDAEYEFVRDGQRLQLHLYDGGAAVYEARKNGDVRTDVELFGLPASLLDYGDGRYRVDVLVGDHTFEFDGEPFAGAGEFLATVAGLRPADAPPPAEVTAASPRSGATEPGATAPAAK